MLFINQSKRLSIGLINFFFWLKFPFSNTMGNRNVMLIIWSRRSWFHHHCPLSKFKVQQSTKNLIVTVSRNVRSVLLNDFMPHRRKFMISDTAKLCTDWSKSNVEKDEEVCIKSSSCWNPPDLEVLTTMF